MEPFDLASADVSGPDTCTLKTKKQGPFSPAFVS